MDELKNEIKYIKFRNKRQFENNKKKKYNDIIYAYQNEKDKKEKEKHFIEVIYSLYIIQKYFIDSKKYNKKDLESDNEYLDLINNNYNIIENKITKESNQKEDNKSIIDFNEKDKDSDLDKIEEENILNNNLNCVNNNNENLNMININKNKL